MIPGLKMKKKSQLYNYIMCIVVAKCSSGKVECMEKDIKITMGYSLSA
jgi:hypothetical protein